MIRFPEAAVIRHPVVEADSRPVVTSIDVPVILLLDLCIAVCLPAIPSIPNAAVVRLFGDQEGSTWNSFMLNLLFDAGIT